MDLVIPRQPKVRLEEPVLKFYEEGDWLRIEAQGVPTRYMRKELAKNMLAQIGRHSVSEKSDLL
jgi:hypothetical protein